MQSRLTRATALLVVAALVTHPATASAQVVIQGQGGGSINPDGSMSIQMDASGMQQQMQALMEKANRGMVEGAIRPALDTMVVAPGTIDIPIKLIAPGSDSFHVRLFLRDEPPEQHAAQQAAAGANSFVESDAPKSSATSMRSWLTGAPDWMSFGPRDTQTVTLHLNVPPSAAPGTYVAYLTVGTLIWTSAVHKDASDISALKTTAPYETIPVTTVDGKTNFRAIKLIYQVKK